MTDIGYYLKNMISLIRVCKRITIGETLKLSQDLIDELPNNDLLLSYSALMACKAMQLVQDDQQLLILILGI